MDSAERTLPFETYLSQASFAVPDFCPESAWADHAPFAFWITETLRPRSFVELGTHGGYSYFAFCQAVKTAALPTRCFAVDTWKGDEHAGFYSEDFYNRVFDHNRTHFAEFSRLVRATFDEAVSHFSDGSIDLLHIDGRHFYGDVKHDFETWQSKLSDRAVVIFHDTNVRERDFGVFRLWEELREEYPSFEFYHGNGLGILGIGPNLPPGIEVFFEACRDPGTAERVRRVYARLGQTFHTQTVASARIAQLVSRAKDLEQRGDELDGVVAELNARIHAAVDGYEKRIGALAHEHNTERAALIHERDVQAERAASFEKRHGDQLHRADALEHRAVELEAEIAAMAQKHADEMHLLHLELQRRHQDIIAIQSSTSWKVTAPLRAGMRIGKTAAMHLRIRAARAARAAYRYAPIPVGVKRTIVSLIFTATGPLFRRTHAYNDWMRMKRLSAKSGIAGVLMFDLDKPPKESACPVELDFSVAVPFNYPLDPPPARVAAICHIFYEQIAPEIQRYLRNIPGAFDVFISTDKPEKKELIEAYFTSWDRGRVEVRVTPNRGRDIAPKLVGFADIYGNYDYVLHLHSKVSKHASVLENWRTYLYADMLGSPEIVKSVFEIFARRPDVGMIGAQHFEPVRHWINWGNNFKDAAILARRMGLHLNSDKMLDFPSGSMFWARASALKPLLDLKLSFEDFDTESGQIDATLAHSIERLYFYSCEAARLRWLKIAHPPLFAHTPGIEPVNAPGDLDRFIAEKAYQLTGANLPAPRKEHEAPLLAASSLIATLQDNALGVSQIVDTKTRVAIGIVTYNNTQEQIERAIRCAQTALAGAGLAHGRIYLIENGSSIPALAGRGDVTLIPSAGNVGFGAGQNRLMKPAFADGADVYIAANPDGAFHPDAIAAMLQMMQAHGNRALIEAVQFPMEHPRYYDPYTFETAWCSGACLMIPRALHAATGGFDESYFLYCEDVDLSWQARAHGFALRTCPRAQFLHNVRDRGSDPKILRFIHSSGLIMARKWGDAKFERWLTDHLVSQKIPVPDIRPTPVPPSWRRFADFDHQFSFAETRW